MNIVIVPTVETGDFLHYCMVVHTGDTYLLICIKIKPCCSAHLFCNILIRLFHT